MKTTDIFKTSSKQINESMGKIFGKKLNLESFDLAQLQDARNKLRTQVSQIRGQSGFNENLENEAFTQAQWMLDAINAEIAEREEFVVDPSLAEVEEGYSSEVEEFFYKVAQEGNYDMIDDAQKGKFGPEIEKAVQDMYDNVSINNRLHPDDDFEEIYDIMISNIESDYGDRDSDPDEGGETDDNYAMASAGFGSDEDYGSYEEDVKKVDVPAYQRKASGDKDWKVTSQDLEKDKERSATTPQGIAKRKKELGMENVANESTQGEQMTKLQEGEIQQASAIVTAKTMVDRVGRWIEELAGMENDTLLQLGDSIRDEIGQEQAKAFIESVAPAIQQALETLKGTRDSLSNSVRTLATGEAPADMLGAEPEAGGEEMPAAEPDAMNMPAEEPAADEFAAAEPAAGGSEAAGREKRESINFGNRLLKVLAG